MDGNQNTEAAVMTNDVIFAGKSEHTLDGKGRLIVPAKFRDGLGARFWVTKGIENCLYLYPESEWRLIADAFRRQPMNTKQKRIVQRRFFAGASECEIDKQGRILIPSDLREFAGIEKDVVSVGNLNHVEIWDAGRYVEETEDDDFDMEDMTAELDDMGIRF